MLRQRLVLPLAACIGVLAAWLAFARAPVGPVRWEPVVEVARGSGDRGPWRQSDSRYDFVDDPGVALAADGSIAVTWVDQARKDVLFQRFAPSGQPLLPAPVNVSRTPGTFSWLPRVVLPADAGDRVAVLWQEIIFSGGSHGGDILFSRSDDGGRTFAVPSNLSRNSTGGDGKGRINREVWHNGSMDLVAAPGGRLYAAWTEFDGTLWFTRSDDGGQRFTPPARLAGSDRQPARAPSIAVAPDGTLYLAWTHGETAATAIQFARSRDGGRSFDAARPVGPAATYADAPRLAVDEAGMVHLAYARSEAGPFAPHRVVYSRSRDGGDSFTSPRDVSAPLAAPFGSAAFPHLVAGRGRVVIAWELFAQPGARPRGLGMAVSTDGGDRFSPPQEVPGSAGMKGGFNGSTQGLFMNKLAMNAAGRLVVANSSLVPGVRSRVWLMPGALPP